jgi:hypothetical protein
LIAIVDVGYFCEGYQEMPAVAFDETTGQHSGETMRILHLIKHCQPSNGNVNVAIDLAADKRGRGIELSMPAPEVITIRFWTRMA